MIRKDGSYSIEYVPAGSYIVRVTDAQDSGGSGQTANAGDSPQLQAAPPVHRYQDKEFPLAVESEMNDVNVPLVEAPKQ